MGDRARRVVAVLGLVALCSSVVRPGLFPMPGRDAAWLLFAAAAGAWLAHTPSSERLDEFDRELAALPP